MSIGSAGRVLGLALNNKGAEADRLMERKFGPRAEKLVHGLAKWQGEARHA